MFITRLRRKTYIRRRKGERETLREDATRFKDLVTEKIKEKGDVVPTRLQRELERASEQRDGGQRLYKLDLRKSHLTDDHVEALTDALQELPVVRKLDLRGNDEITVQAMRRLNTLLKGQVELFRLVQTDVSLADSSLSFLYSVKLDASVMALDPEVAEEMESQAAALEVADSVLDVRHAFFQADIRETGTLTEPELGIAMRTVMGATPKAGETARILRFFGERGAEGRDPSLINLGGFEAAMVGRLREAHTLPVLPQSCDDIIFGSGEDKGDQATSDCFSPWSTRSFGATTGGIELNEGGGGGGGVGGSKGKRGPLSASERFSKSSGGTQVLSLPPWRESEADSELTGTLKDGASCDIVDERPRLDGSDGRNATDTGADKEMENVFDDDPGHNGQLSALTERDRKSATHRIGGDHARGSAQNGEEGRRHEDEGTEDETRKRGGRGAIADGGLPAASTSPLASTLQREELSNGGISASTRRQEVRPGFIRAGSSAEYCCLTEGGSTDDDASSYSRLTQKDWWPAKDMRLRSEDFAGENNGEDKRRHSSAVAGRGEGNAVAKRRSLLSRVADMYSRGRSKSTQSQSEDATSYGIEGLLRPRAKTWPIEFYTPGNEEDLGVLDHPHFSQIYDIYGPLRSLSDVPIISTTAPVEIPGGTAGVPPFNTNDVQMQAMAKAARQESDAGAGEDAGTVEVSSPPSIAGTRGNGRTTGPKSSNAGSSSPSAQPLFEEEVATPSGKSASAPETDSCMLFGDGPEVPEIARASGSNEENIAFEGRRRSAPVPRSNTSLTEDAEERTTDEAEHKTGPEAAAMAVTGTPRANSTAIAKGVEHPELTVKVRTPRSTGAAAGVTGQGLGIDEESLGAMSPSHLKSKVRLAAAAAPGVSPQSLVTEGTSAAGENSGVVRAGKNDRIKEHGGSGPIVSRGGTTGSSFAKSQTLQPRRVVDESGSGTEPGLAPMAPIEIQSPMEALTDASGGESCGRGSGVVPDALAAAADPSSTSSDIGGIPMRLPHCLAPANITTTARTAAYTCRERERLVSRIQRSVGDNASTPARTAGRRSFDLQRSPADRSRVVGFNAKLGRSGSMVSGLGICGGYGRGGGGGGFNPNASLVSDHPGMPRAASPSARGGSPEPVWRHGGSRGGGISERSHADEDLGGRRSPGSSPSSRFHLSASESKTAPLCSAGGSTALYDAAGIIANAGGTEGACLFSPGFEAGWQGTEQGYGAKEVAGVSGVGVDGGLSATRSVHQDEEKQLTVHFDKGALVLSHNSLTNIGIALELEANYGLGRDALIDLHTLVLRCNQLQALDFTVLTATPALRHLDVSNNLLCRMEPVDGRDLPPQLETLNMSHNRISRIGGIGHCCALRVINLRHNRIKLVLGLEHLCHLEQLDLGHNLISKTASARALSFNRSLKLLCLQGNPLADNPRYRPTLTCLLPHVRAIDRRGMPPSYGSDRRWSTGSKVGGRNPQTLRGDTAPGAGAGGDGQRTTSRGWQAEQDERRSSEWRETLNRREQQAEGEKRSEERQARDNQDTRHVAAQQRRVVEELARPKTRTCPSEEVINKAKDVACHRPNIAFGITYRRDTEGDASVPASGATTAQTVPATANATEPWHQQDFTAANASLVKDRTNGGDSGSGRGEATSRSLSHGKERDGNQGGDGRDKGGGGSGSGASAEQGGRASQGIRFADTPDSEALGRNSSLAASEIGRADPAVAYVCGNERSTPPLFSSSLPHSQGLADVPYQQVLLPPTPSPLAAAQSPRSPRTSRWANADSMGSAGPTSVVNLDRTLGVNEGDEGAVPSAEGATHTEISAGGAWRGGSGARDLAPDGGTEVLEGWLKDVRLETETAGTALQVLLKMRKDGGPRSGGGNDRLARFRTAVEGMGLFSESHGPAPEFVGDGDVHAGKVMAAARRVAMTKAAVKNMLRLMEEAAAGKRGNVELDQYTEFVRQQGEIFVGGGGGLSESSIYNITMNVVPARNEAARIAANARNGVFPGHEVSRTADAAPFVLAPNNVIERTVALYSPSTGAVCERGPYAANLLGSASDTSRLTQPLSLRQSTVGGEGGGGRRVGGGNEDKGVERRTNPVASGSAAGGTEAFKAPTSDTRNVCSSSAHENVMETPRHGGGSGVVKLNNDAAGRSMVVSGATYAVDRMDGPSIGGATDTKFPSSAEETGGRPRAAPATGRGKASSSVADADGVESGKEATARAKGGLAGADATATSQMNQPTLPVEIFVTASGKPPASCSPAVSAGVADIRDALGVPRLPGPELGKEARGARGITSAFTRPEAGASGEGRLEPSNKDNPRSSRGRVEALSNRASCNEEVTAPAIATATTHAAPADAVSPITAFAEKGAKGVGILSVLEDVVVAREAADPDCEQTRKTRDENLRERHIKSKPTGRASSTGGDAVLAAALEEQGAQQSTPTATEVLHDASPTGASLPPEGGPISLEIARASENVPESSSTVHLSVQERLLRHVRQHTASSPSGSDSCSNVSDEDGGEKNCSGIVAQHEEIEIARHEEGHRKEGKRAGGGDKEVEEGVGKDEGMGDMSRVPGARPNTTPPRERAEGGERLGRADHTERAATDSAEHGVTSVTNSKASPTAALNDGVLNKAVSKVGPREKVASVAPGTALGIDTSQASANISEHQQCELSHGVASTTDAVHVLISKHAAAQGGCWDRQEEKEQTVPGAPSAVADAKQESDEDGTSYLPVATAGTAEASGDQSSSRRDAEGVQLSVSLAVGAPTQEENDARGADRRDRSANPKMGQKGEERVTTDTTKSVAGINKTGTVSAGESVEVTAVVPAEKSSTERTESGPEPMLSEERDLEHPGAVDGDGGDINRVDSRESKDKSRGISTAQSPENTGKDAEAEPAWIEGYDPAHDCYFYHHVATGESSWYKPEEPYEPYVHSDEEDDDQIASLSQTENEGNKGTQSREADQRAERRRRNDKEGISSSSRADSRGRDKPGSRRKKHEEGRAISTAKKTSSARQGSGKRSPKSPAAVEVTQVSARQGSSRRDAGASQSSLPSGTESPGSGSSVKHSRGGRSRSRQQGKTALERLNDLTDENSGVSDSFRSKVGGRGQSGRRRHKSPRHHIDERSHGSTRRSSGGGDDGARREPVRSSTTSSRKGRGDRGDHGAHYRRGHSPSPGRRHSVPFSESSRSSSNNSGLSRNKGGSNRRRHSSGSRAKSGRLDVDIAASGRSGRDARERER